MDVSKQIVGMGAAHASGLLIAIIAHNATDARASECSWYFVAFTFDTSIGVALTMLLHKAILLYLRRDISLASLETNERESLWQDCTSSRDPAAILDSLPPPTENESWKVAIVDCGKYGDPPLLRRWALQAGEWSCCVVVARALCGGIVAILASLLAVIAEGLDSVFDGHPTILLFFVMICCPLLMNAAQLLVQDAILKGRIQWGAATTAVEISDAGRGSLLWVQEGHQFLNVSSQMKPPLG